MTRQGALAAVAALLVLTACGDDSDPPARPRAAETTLVADLCVVLDAAAAGDVDRARSSFDHGPLHTLADDATGADRSVAARLLEAKEAVESGLAADDPDPDELVTDLDALIEATGDALEATGASTSPTCETENP